MLDKCHSNSFKKFCEILLYFFLFLPVLPLVVINARDYNECRGDHTLHSPSFCSHLIKVKLPHTTEMTKRKKIYEIISLDKKNSNNKINLILLKGIGKAFYCRGLKITDVKNV